MTCLQVVDQVTEYMEGQLSLQERLAYRLHLLSCRPCRIYVRQMKLIVAAMGQTPHECPCKETKETLMNCYRKR